MSNLHNLFQKFNENITLTATKKDNLRRGRNALREKIRKDFKENERKVPNFCGQGSFMMKTTINPLPGDEYDIDDGIYLNGYSDKPIDEWPTTETVHRWIKKAVDGHTDTPPVDKNTCVRVIYANDYHIDLPSYILKNDVAYLAHKKDGWIESDPKAFTDWFINKVISKGEQLRSLVKYLKAWKDYKEVKLKGITITILVAENFYSYENRDDKALLGTVIKIYNKLYSDFKCKKPVTPYEDLLAGYSESAKESVLEELLNLKDNLDKAINEDDEEKASEYMIDSFGSRFPKGESKKSENAQYIVTDSPAILKNDGRSA